MMLHRKEIIEKRKEYMEQLNTERERQEKEAAEAEKQKAMLLEQQRLAKEAEEREKQRKQRELDDLAKKQTMDKIEQMKKTALGQKALADLKPEELEELDPDSLLAKQVQQLEMEKKELQAKLAVQMKKVDHFERAKRSIEIPKRHEQYKQKLIDDEKFHHDQEMKRIAKAKASRQLSLDTQNRLLRMADGQRAFIDTVQNRRKADYEVHIFASL
jgi:translation initiation factor 3 subunit A